MWRKSNVFFLTGFVFFFSSCTPIDNYMLGQDNRPKPEALKPIHSKVKLVNQWSLASATSKKSAFHPNSKLKPEIIGDIVYVADNSGLVQAVKKENGKVLWLKKLNTGILSGPTISSNRIAITTDSSKVILLHQQSGQELWEAKVSGDVLSKPVIAGNKILAKTIDGNLYAFDLATGKELWRSNHGAPSLILKASSSPVVIHQKVVLVGYSDGKLDAVDLNTGRLLWQRDIAYANGASDVERLVDIDADPIIRGDVVYLASYQGYVGALSLIDGQFLWRKPASVYKNMVVDEKALYLTDSEDVVWSLNRQNGEINWKQQGLKARGLTDPVLLKKNLVLADKTGMIHVLACQTGEFVSRMQLGGAVSVSPSASGPNIYVLTNAGQLNRLSVG